MHNQPFSKILIPVVMLALVLGGIFAWQYFKIPEEKEKVDEVDIASRQEKIIFSVEQIRYRTYGSPERDSYTLYSMNLDGSSKKPIFSYTPDTTSGSVIQKLNDERILLYRVESDIDTKVLNSAGKGVSFLEVNYAAEGRTPIFVYFSPDRSKSVYQIGSSEVEIYHRETKKVQRFVVDLRVPGELGLEGFLDENHIIVGWGDAGFSVQGLVELDYETGMAAIVDRQSFSASAVSRSYLNARTILAYENQPNEFGIGYPPSPPSSIYTVNLDTQKRSDAYQSNDFAIYYDSFSPDRNALAFYGMKNGEPRLLVAKIRGNAVDDFQDIRLTVVPKGTSFAWSMDNKKLVYVSERSFDAEQPSPQEIIVIDLETKESKHIDISSMAPNSNDYIVNVIGVFKEVQTNEADGWQTYRNEQLGFEFKYPDEYIVSSFASGKTPQVIVPTSENIADTCFYKGEQPQYFVRDFENGKITLNNIVFCVTKIGDAGAGSVFTTYYYTTSKDGRFITIKFDVQYSGCGGYYGLPQFPECEEFKQNLHQNIEEPIEKILSTFRFAEAVEGADKTFFSARQDVSGSPTVTVNTQGLTAVNGAQVKVNHPRTIEISNPQCTGLFQGATVLGPIPMEGGTLIGCVLVESYTLEQSSGAVIDFRVKLKVPEGGFQSATLFFGEGGPKGTMFSKDGEEVSAGDLSSILTVPL